MQGRTSSPGHDDTDQSQIRPPFYNPIDLTAPKRWPGYTLIVPVCAVGNIGQLACDLIISTLLNRKECHLIGRIYSPALMAVVGPNAFSLDGPPSTSTEIYGSEKHKLIVIQQRTSYHKELKNLYIQDMASWVKESQFDRVLVLSSSFSQCNPDITLLGEFPSPSKSVYSITTNLFDSQNKIWSDFGVKPLETPKTSKVLQDGLSFLPGSGLTKSLIKAFEKSTIPAAFLICFCSEGINMAECYEVANLVDKFIGLENKRDCWIEPLSWKFNEADLYDSG